MRCIVLSGATVPFQELVDAVDPQLVALLRRLGYTEIEVQYGYAEPPNVPGVRYFDFDADIRARVHASQLVISHAGTGSILDAVERGEGLSDRKIIVVVNKQLMNNHQLEVATKLEKLSCIYVCTSPQSLGESVEVISNRKFARLESPTTLQDVVDQELGRRW